MFKKILISNRGEIALRINRTAREMGIKTVAVFHEVDKEAPFVQMADFAYQLQGESPKSAYLDIEQIIEIAKNSGSEAIHPGYGFLSENANFARSVEDEGIVFIGPKPHSIEAMGSKTKARQLMEDAGVPIVPGTKHKIENLDDAKQIAKEIGYPILLKAAAGGGGKGMRRVNRASEFVENFEAASREALNSFGDDTIYIEKLIENPKHIEIQIIGDKHGNYAYLFERDCSIQRRHQKLIEEAPSTALDDDLREHMGRVAIEAAKAVDYVNAGTIEFLFDKNRNFYFLEMNTRLQVEHPVTEMITGIDLVKEQIQVAYGKPLSFSQKDLKINGYAIECRINAEDPFNNFMPDTGKINYLRVPGGSHTRCDIGIEHESEVGVHFDPMLAKLITWGSDRFDALNRMERALRNFKIKGIKTNIPFHLTAIRHPEFRYGYFDTGFIEHSFDFESMERMKLEHEELIAAIGAYGFRMLNISQISRPEGSTSKWKENNLMLRRMV